MKLYQACFSNDIEEAMKYISNEETNVNWATEGTTCLYVACYNGNILLSKQLLNRADIQPHAGLNPFHAACLSKSKELIQHLLAHPNIDPCKGSGEGNDPLFSLCLQGETDLVQLLLRDGRFDPAKICQGIAPFALACEMEHHTLVQLLLQDPRVDPNVLLSNGVTPLLHYCSKKNLPLIKAFFQNPKTDPNILFNGITPFNLICAFGSGELMDLFLHDERVELDLCEDGVIPPLYSLLSSPQPFLLEQVIASGRTVSTQKASWMPSSLAEFARELNFPDLAELIESYTENPKAACVSTREKLDIPRDFFLSFFFYFFSPLFFHLFSFFITSFQQKLLRRRSSS